MHSLTRATSFALILSALSFQAANASEDGHPERIKHYDFDEPKTSQEAKILYGKSIDDIASVLKKESLNHNDLEEVHRISYALEASIETFEKQKTYNHKLVDEIEETVEELHEASEDHKEADTRKWFSQLARLNIQLK